MRVQEFNSQMETFQGIWEFLCSKGVVVPKCQLDYLYAWREEDVVVGHLQVAQVVLGRTEHLKKDKISMNFNFVQKKNHYSKLSFKIAIFINLQKKNAYFALVLDESQSQLPVRLVVLCVEVWQGVHKNL